MKRKKEKERRSPGDEKKGKKKKEKNKKSEFLRLHLRGVANIVLRLLASTGTRLLGTGLGTRAVNISLISTYYSQKKKKKIVQ